MSKAIGKLLVAFVAMALSVTAPANATPIAPDDFNAENGGVPQLNYFGFGHYTVSSGSVDLIGNGYYDAYPGNGLYVDVAGSTGQYGALTTNTVYGAGHYEALLGLGGPIYSGITDGVRVSWAGGFQDFILNGLTTNSFAFDINLTSPSALTVSDLALSGNPNIGATLFGLAVQPRTA